ncbi:hypothetical protein M885DRAFT_547957 [Pelagophyceae sp. CCMP2097]|nr:hypothetical protein M885DRAFT_547957 [Pelagophyceae sp. CCMP2097]
MGRWGRWVRLYHGASWDGAAAVSAVAGCVGLFVEAGLRTTTRDADSADNCRYTPTTKLLTPEHVRTLEQDGLVVLTGVLSTSALAAARRDAVKVRKRASTTNEDYRDDAICWVRESDGTADAGADERRLEPIGKGLLHCLRLLRGVASELESKAYDESTVGGYRVPKQCQLACYGGGSSGYFRHRDRCMSDFFELGPLEYLRLSDYRDRAVTAILYLNEAWPLVDGGALRCFGERDSPDSPQAFQDIAPAGGTLVLFHAGRIDHAVLPARKDRYALTLWIAKPGFQQRPPRLDDS